VYPRAKYPVTPGHEFTGTIRRQKGSKLDSMIGDRVAVNPNIPCGACHYCRTGKKYLCRNLVVIGGSKLDGAMQGNLWIPEENALKIHEADNELNMSLTEPLAVAVHSIAQLGRPEKLLVMGLGTIGTMILLYLQNTDSELHIAELNIKDLYLPGDIEVKELVDYRDLDGREEFYDNIIMACPYDSLSLYKCLSAIRRGGRIVLVGLSKEIIHIDFGEVLKKEVSIIPSFKYSEQDFKTALDYLEKNELLDYLNAEVFPIDQAPIAFEYKVNNPRSKVILSFPNHRL
jgi:threonine dehydrogenase-like Zn-dependent dehydrogenase